MSPFNRPGRTDLGFTSRKLSSAAVPTLDSAVTRHVAEQAGGELNKAAAQEAYYNFSPFGQKTKYLLTGAGINFKKCDQPLVLPRPDLEALGITYRRIPLLAVGKDVYCDSSRMIDLALSKLSQSGGSLVTSPADKAYEDWGIDTFKLAVFIIPQAAITPGFLNDRKTIFPMLERPDFASLRPSSLAAFRQRCRVVEDVYLANGGPFINGDKLGVADIHVIFGIKWALVDLGVAQEPGLGKQDLPKTWKLIESLPEIKPEVVGSEETIKTIKSASYSADGPTSTMANDPTGIQVGSAVTVESLDTVPGAHPQKGKLVGTSANEFVIEVGNDGVRVHFPWVGYILRAQ